MTQAKNASGQDDSYRVLFENSADAILLIKSDKFVDCNRAAVEMLRSKNKATVLQTHPSELSPEYQPDGQRSFEKANEMMAIAFKEGSHRFEWDHVRMDGEVFPVEVLLTAIPSDNGFDLHTVWRDITDRKKLENELRHSQKMEAIGKLAGGIAHDFNNQLVPILGYVEILKDALNNRPELLAHIDAIDTAGHRAAALVQRLMAFSHKDIRRAETVDLSAVVDSLLDVIGTLIGEDIELVLTTTDTVLPVEMDPGDIEQIILNLATNARDALPIGGQISLALSEVTYGDRVYARMEMVDQGVGMDRKTLSQIFEPFFTTKELGSGTGLGLSTVYSLITKANGLIKAQSELGKGTRFDILLPRAEGPLTVESASIDEPSPPRPAKQSRTTTDAHILVAEDNDLVAELVERVLTNKGYKVTRASEGAEAFSLVKKHSFDLILSDVIMPGMSGPQMAREMRLVNINTPVVFMSGYADDRLAVHGFDESGVGFLRKPFAPLDLLQAVRSALSD